MQFADVQIVSVQDSTLYRITVNISNADFTSDADATLAEILTGLVGAVNGLTEPVTARAIGTDRVYILPDVLTATHTYTVNSTVLLDLTVGFQSVKPLNPGFSSHLFIGGTPGGGTVLRSVLPFSGAPPVPLQFQVVLVIPLNSNTVRVFFSEEPRHLSALSANDALNRLNWEIRIQAGPGTDPVVTSIENAQPQPSQFPMTFPGAWSVDVRTDRQIRFGTTYLTVAGSAIAAASDNALQPDPDDRDDHPGIV